MRPSALLRKVAATIAREGMARRGEHVLVAVSGGPDSVATLAALDALAPQWAFRLTVAHLDHGLRGPAGGRDLEFVRTLARRFGLQSLTATAAIPPGANLEARAREVRYRFLHDAARSAGCGRIAVGHTQTDQAETVLLRLLRGAGARGLSGMAYRRGRVVRPLLDCTRPEVMTFLRDNTLAWVEDPTNRDEHFTRNLLRHRVLPALVAHVGPGVVAGLARTADLLRAEDTFLDEHAHRALVASARGSRLDAGALRATPAAIRRRVLRLWLEGARGSPRGIGSSHVRALEKQLDGHESALVTLPGGTVRCEADIFEWQAGPEPLPEPFSATLAPGARVVRDDLGWEVSLSEPMPWTAEHVVPENPWTAVIDLHQLPGPLSVRSVRAGDRIRPIGLNGTQKLQDVFINAKVPRGLRRRIPLLVSGGEVVWVPGLRRSVVARVTPVTTTAALASFRRWR